ncbi:MAG: Methyltransferase FkbM [Prosthecobacter sp.]|nr:Methyltransferase FkbM [Prosthecobacter sp.]
MLGKLRTRVRDALPPSLGMCLTLRANPILGLAFRLFRRRFHLTGMTFKVPLEGMSWRSLATYWFDDYEAPEREFCTRFIRPADRVCELGGCLGIVSMTINRLLTAPETHLVVEANPALIPFLTKNRELNQGRFRVLQCAVGDGSPLPLDVSSGLLTSTRAVGDSAAKIEMVPGCTVDSLFSQHGPFDVVVMDVEGAEEQVFLGAGRAWNSVRLIIVEWHPTIIGQEVFERAKSELIAAGFQCIASRPGSPHIVEAWEKIAA